MSANTIKSAGLPNEMWQRSQIVVSGVLLATVGVVTVATAVAAYGLAMLCFFCGGLVAVLGYTHGRETVYGRMALATFLIAAGSYFPSATTLTEVTATTVNAQTLRPAVAYPFIMGLKFIPLFVLVATYWVLLFLRDNFGFRRHPGSGKAYLLIGAVFLTMTGVSVATSCFSRQREEADRSPFTVF